MRRYLVLAHLWLGLTIGAFWALQGLTGAVLVFNRDIQPLLLDPPATAAKMLPLDEIFSRASAAAGAQVTQVENFTPDPALLVAYYKNAADEKKTLVMDGRTGVVLDWRDPEPMLPAGGSSWKWLLHLHESLLAGETGLLIVGTSGLLLLTSLLLGFWIGWPRRRMWRDTFRIGRWRTTAQRLFGWHRMAGLCLGAILLVSASCGAYLAFAPTLRPLLIATTDFRAPYKPLPVETLQPPALTVQQALDRARQPFPGAVIVRATLPNAKAPVYAFRLLQQGEARRWAGTTTVAVDPGTGRVLDLYDPLVGPKANRLSDLVYPVHTGEAFGPLARVLVMLGGLTLPGLYVTGLWAWLRKRRRRAAVEQPASLATHSV